ncbi:MAG: hypothetical protein ACTFAL_00885 [Candidatus Electronema sp. V4]|uniref:hypothetical protein n=1 Tax=Candidatus Electronema sp. V4 TaxID=3454756 RepID=UPI0040555DCD
MKNNLREQLGDVLEPPLVGGKKILPDCEKVGRAWLEVYFLDFFQMRRYKKYTFRGCAAVFSLPGRISMRRQD